LISAFNFQLSALIWLISDFDLLDFCFQLSALILISSFQLSVSL